MKHANWLVLARDGEMLLAAERLPANGDFNPRAILYNEFQGTSSQEQDLQVFFKWGNFEAVDPPIALGEMVAKKGGSRGLQGYGWTLEVKGGRGSGHWGHAGRPGKRGGSLPGGGLSRVCRRPEGDEQRQGAENAQVIADAFSNETYYDNWRHASRSERGAVKNKLVTALAETSGVDYDTCNKIVKQWSYTSGDTDMRSLALQKDTAKEFGEQLSSFTKWGLDYVEKEAAQSEAHGAAGWVNPLYPEDVQRRVQRAQYDNTQRFLREHGIGPDDVVTLYRGTRWQRKDTVGWKEGDEIAFHDNTLASWSTDIGIARRFMRHGTKGRDGAIFEINVPARMIFSTALTGVGCLTEAEIVLLGGRGTARLVELSEGYD